MEIVNYNTTEVLNELGSALTIEGLREDSYQEFLDWIKQFTPLKSERVYVINGNDMNKICNLTGDNAYNNDIHIVSVKLEDMEDFSAVLIPRFQINARWLDDIVWNNAQREQ